MRWRVDGGSRVAGPILMVRLIEIGAVCVILLDFTRVVARLVGLEVALGWDEAVYAVRARGWVDAEAPLVGWQAIRPPFLPLLASPAALFAPNEVPLRLVGILSGLGLLLGAWWLARTVSGALAGVAVLAVLHSSPTLQQNSAYLLTDVPSAALLLVILGLVWRELEVAERPGPGLAVAAVLAGIAFLTRYGVVLALVPMLVLSAAIWWRGIIAAPRWPLIAAGVGGIFVIGHLVWSVLVTGSPLGIVGAAYEILPSWESSPPMVMFRKWLPLELAGSVGMLAIMVGFLALPITAAVALIHPPFRRPMRAMILVATLGIWQVAILVLGTPHVEQRYFVFAIACLVTAGISLVALAVMALPSPLRVLATIAFIVFVSAERGSAVDYAAERTWAVGRVYESFRLAGEELDRRAPADCSVFGGGGPVVSWYSGCDVLPIADVTAASKGGPDSVETRWLLVFASRDAIDTEAPAPSAALQRAIGDPIPIFDPRRDQPVATLWALER